MKPAATDNTIFDYIIIIGAGRLEAAGRGAPQSGDRPGVKDAFRP
jgi:hypothetical protein